MTDRAVPDPSGDRDGAAEPRCIMTVQSQKRFIERKNRPVTPYGAGGFG